MDEGLLTEYEKCITCKDYGKNCRGPKLEALRTISNVREHHRRLRTYRKIPMKPIFDLTEHEISNGTVKDYFSHEEKDFRWTTVALIDSALAAICGGVADQPELLANCPATSGEIRDQMAAALVTLREKEAECLALQTRIAEQQQKHIEQMDEYRKDQQARVEWLTADIRLWRKIAFALLGVLVLAMCVLAFYLVIDLGNSEFGFFRINN